MKYRFFSILVLVIAVAGCASQRIISQDFTPSDTVHYSNMDSVDDISEHVFYLDEGDRIGVRVSLDSGFLAIEDSTIDLVLRQKIYFRVKMPVSMKKGGLLRMTEEEKRQLLKHFMVYLSADAKRWARYTDIKAVEELFGTAGGSSSLDLVSLKINS